LFGLEGSKQQYPKQLCYEMALTLNPMLSPAWHNLGAVGGGTVKGKKYSKEQCFTKSEQLDEKEKEEKEELFQRP